MPVAPGLPSESPRVPSESGTRDCGLRADVRLRVRARRVFGPAKPYRLGLRLGCRLGCRLGRLSLPWDPESEPVVDIHTLNTLFANTQKQVWIDMHTVIVHSE